MSYLAAIRNLREELKQRLSLSLAQLFVVTKVGKSSKIGNDDALETADSSNEQRPATRIEPFGFRSRPTNKLRGLGIRLGTSNLMFIGVLPSEGYGPQDLDDGESAMYSAGGQELRMKSDGTIQAKDKNGTVVATVSPTGAVTVASAAGQDITVQPGAGGNVKLGSVGNLALVMQGSTDSFGVPITLANPTTNVKGG
jgi:phage gp45-like